MASVAARSPNGAQAYFLSIDTLLRRPLFLDHDAARAVARMQDQASIWARSQCMAWSLMPDRWQGLVVLGAGDCLERLVSRFKAASARAVEPRFRINGWLWAKGFSERAVHGEGDLLSAARQLVSDPVRLGLASSVGMYPYWNAVWLETRHAPDAGSDGLLREGAANTMSG